MNGYLKFRRSFLEHLQDGRITFSEFGVAVIIYSAANPETGLWIGSARRLAMEYRMTSERMARKILESLERKVYIKRFATPGRHNNYPVLCNRYEITAGVRAGMFINAVKTNNYLHPVLENSPAQVRAWGEHGASTGPLKSLKKENRDKKRTRPHDSRAIPSPDEHKNRIENKVKRLVRDVEAAKEIACGGPVDLPRSLRDAHPDLQTRVIELARRMAT